MENINCVKNISNNKCLKMENIKVISSKKPKFIHTESIISRYPLFYSNNKCLKMENIKVIKVIGNIKPRFLYNPKASSSCL